MSAIALVIDCVMVVKQRISCGVATSIASSVHRKKIKIKMVGWKEHQSSVRAMAMEWKNKGTHATTYEAERVTMLAKGYIYSEVEDGMAGFLECVRACVAMRVRTEI